MQLHNTLTNKTEPFVSIVPDHVTLYTCGPTVYSEPLIGNWVAYIRWDLLVRVLRANGFEVKRVMNITDVGHLVSDNDEGEDKIQKGARKEGVSAWEIADRYTNRFLEGMTELNLEPPEILSKATETIDEQIDLIRNLEKKGHTYQIDDGIYFDTSTFPSYPDFARLHLDALRPGARIEENKTKRNPSDFALWKFSPVIEKRDMEWDSPWGKGFPGWHIECSAMAQMYLGETIDIHTGGIDHIPVHHTNEIAQSESATGKRFANFWLHANFLMVEGKKISKSLGNGYTLSELKDKGYSPLDFRMFVMQSHYRTETNFTWENIAAAKTRLEHWKAVACLRHQLVVSNDNDIQLDTIFTESSSKILDSLNTDLNSPQAMLSIESVFDHIEKAGFKQPISRSFIKFLSLVDDMLGLNLLSATPDISQEQKELIRKREIARETKNWQLSDKLRNDLALDGIGINDTAEKSIWFYL